MTRPNELSAPGEGSARDRVDTLFAALDRRSWDDLLAAPRPELSMLDRGARRAELEQLATRHGREALLADARGAIRGALTTRLVPLERGLGGMAQRPLGGTAEETARVMIALDLATCVAVLEDLLEPDEAAALADPGRRLVGLPPLGREPDGPEGGAWDGPDIPAGVAARPARTPWTPTADDWAAAAHGDLAIDHAAPPPGTRAMRAAFFGIVAITGAPALVAWGITEGSVWVGLLGAIALIAVCWTLATWRRPR